MPTPVTCDCTPCCDIGEDSFDRADSDSLGVDWSERSGDADIASNKLLFASAGLVRYETAHPDGNSGNQHVYVQFILDSYTSGYARVIVNYTDDSNYLYAALEYVSSCWVLRLRQVSGGSDTSLQDDLPIGEISITTMNFRVCWHATDGHLSARLETPAVFYTIATSGVTIADGDQVGLAGSTNVQFDNFEFKKLQTESLPTCPECASECFVGLDAFARSDSTSLGCQWDESSGSWEISSDQLKKTSTGAGIAKFKMPHPERGLGHYVEVDCVLPNSAPNAARRHRVLVNYLDSSNYHYAELWVNQANTSVTLLIGKAGGSTAQIAQTATGGTYRLVVCWDDVNETLTASVQTTDWTLGRSMSSTRVASGIYVALGAGPDSTDGGEQFDNFEFWKHASEEDGEEDCPDCIEFSTEDPACCCDDTVDAYVVDLGAGGWTDGALSCGDCAGVSGEYHVQYGGTPGVQFNGVGCGWFYQDERFCSDGEGTLRIELANGLSGPCQWGVLVQLIRNDGDSYIDAQESYVSELLPDTSCDDDLTLTKAFTQGPQQYCVVGLPTTVTVTKA
jgi:hypothetical protein